MRLPVERSSNHVAWVEPCLSASVPQRSVEPRRGERASQPRGHTKITRAAHVRARPRPISAPANSTFSTTSHHRQTLTLAGRICAFAPPIPFSSIVPSQQFSQSDTLIRIAPPPHRHPWPRPSAEGLQQAAWSQSCPRTSSSASSIMSSFLPSFRRARTPSATPPF